MLPQSGVMTLTFTHHQSYFGWPLVLLFPSHSGLLIGLLTFVFIACYYRKYLFGMHCLDLLHS